MRGPAVSFRWKMALSVSLLLMAVAGAVATALIRSERFFLTEEAEKRVGALAEYLAVSARDPLLAGDELRLGAVTLSVIRDPDARYAYLIDHQGTVVYHSDSNWIGKIRPTDMP